MAIWGEDGSWWCVFEVTELLAGRFFLFMEFLTACSVSSVILLRCLGRGMEQEQRGGWENGVFFLVKGESNGGMGKWLMVLGPLIGVSYVYLLAK